MIATGKVSGHQAGWALAQKALNLCEKGVCSVKFKSSNLKKGNYDPKTRTLTMWFRSGHVYEYYDVPEEEVIRLEKAQSAGSYFAANIRNEYKFKKLEE